MGIFRLILACCVAIGHGWGLRTTPYFAIVSPYYAVQMFFVISGFYMALVLNGTYRSEQNFNGRFYFNRMLRLLPAYLVVALVFVLAMNALHPDAMTPNVGWWHQSDTLFAGHAGVFWYLVFTNLTLIGQDLAAFIPAGRRLAYEYLVVPQAWSIGAEIWFYLAAPWLVRLRSRWLCALVIVGLALRLGIMSTDLPFWPWQQRLAATEYVYFVLGILSFRAMPLFAADLPGRREVGLVALALVLGISCFIGRSGLGQEMNIQNSVLIAALTAICLPSIFNLTKNSILDRIAGEFCYPVYLTHLGVLYLFPEWGNQIYGLRVLGAALVLSVPLVFLVERPIEKLRRRIAENRIMPATRRSVDLKIGATGR